jgi:hypothetical protein
MAASKYTVHGFLGYELVIDGSVETNVLFGFTDGATLAWYGFKSTPAKWHQAQFDDYNYSELIRKPRPTPEADDNFGTADFVGHHFVLPGQFSRPGQFSVADLASKVKGAGTRSIFAHLSMTDDTGASRGVLSIPAKGVSLTFGLVTLKKRRTLDLTKDGFVELIVIEAYSHHALMVGPNPHDLASKRFRKGPGKTGCR